MYFKTAKKIQPRQMWKQKRHTFRASASASIKIRPLPASASASLLYYMIKRVLTFVSGVQESVLLDFISQNKVKVLHKVKTCQNCLHRKFPSKNIKTYISFIFVEF